IRVSPRIVTVCITFLSRAPAPEERAVQSADQTAVPQIKSRKSKVKKPSQPCRSVFSATYASSCENLLEVPDQKSKIPARTASNPRISGTLTQQPRCRTQEWSCCPALDIFRNRSSRFSYPR